MNTVKISDSRVHTLTAVSVVIAPCRLGCVACSVAAGDGEIYGIESSSCSALEECQILGTCENGTAAASVVLAGSADDLACAVNGAVAGLCDELSLAVTVKIGYAHLSVVLSCTDVDAHIYAPELLSCKGIAVDVDIACISCLGVVLGVAGVPFQEYLVLTVAVNVADTAVIWRICTGASVGHCESARNVQRNIEVVRAGGEAAVLRGDDLAVSERVDAVLGVGAALCVPEVGSLAGLARVDELVVAVEAEFSIVGIVGIIAPAHEHSVTRLYRVDTAVEVLHDCVTVAAHAVSCVSRERCSLSHEHTCCNSQRGDCRGEPFEFVHCG